MKRTATVAATLAPAVIAVAAAFFNPGHAQAQSVQLSVEQSIEQMRGEFARAVYLNSATRVHNENPQPLLRAVVVLRIRLDENNRWQAEVFRDNPEQPDMTRAALESVARLPLALGLSPESQQALRNEGLVEAWLFQNDGRFALKTLAKAQKGG